MGWVSTPGVDQVDDGFLSEVVDCKLVLGICMSWLLMDSRTVICQPCGEKIKKIRGLGRCWLFKNCDGKAEANSSILQFREEEKPSRMIYIMEVFFWSSVARSYCPNILRQGRLAGNHLSCHWLRLITVKWYLIISRFLYVNRAEDLYYAYTIEKGRQKETEIRDWKNRVRSRTSDRYIHIGWTCNKYIK
jgi:hypothetical protein